uniref:uncharacterized protein n=1 Tax=Centroberyx gerrardi TaxID=166262 RepID=UPI003AB084DE
MKQLSLETWVWLAISLCLTDHQGCLLRADLTPADTHDGYENFKNQHIYKEMNASECTEVIKARNIHKDKDYKKTNTFICADEEQVKSIYCTDDQIFVTKTARVGENVTLTCIRDKFLYTGTLFWIRLVAGNLPEVLGATFTFDYDGVNETPRITAKQEPGQFVLHITKTKTIDTAFYYCIRVEQRSMRFLNATFLRIKGQEPNINAVQVFPSKSVHPGDSVTLQCSVLSDPQTRSCPGEHSVFWFRVGSDESHPNIIYTHGNSHDECEKSPETPSAPHSCVYSFCKNVSSSDAGTYYCAVAACGEILFGNGAKLQIEGALMKHCGDVAKRPQKATVTNTEATAGESSGKVRPVTAKTRICPGEHSVFWFRAGSDESHPNIIYTHENRSDECEKSPETLSAPHSCVYSFSKSVSSSDDGTYYCAVATCGEILFGNGAKLEIDKTAGPVFIALIMTAACLALSVIGNVILICKQNPRVCCDQRKGIGRASSQAKHDDLSKPARDRTEDGDGLNYAALHFSERKATRGQKKTELPEECVYSRVKH